MIDKLLECSDALDSGSSGQTTVSHGVTRSGLVQCIVMHFPCGPGTLWFVPACRVRVRHQQCHKLKAAVQYVVDPDSLETLDRPFIQRILIRFELYSSGAPRQRAPLLAGSASAPYRTPRTGRSTPWCTCAAPPSGAGCSRHRLLGRQRAACVAG